MHIAVCADELVGVAAPLEAPARAGVEHRANIEHISEIGSR